jgi:hypothetical protein
LLQDKQSTLSVISPSGVVVKTIQSNNLDKVIQLDVSSLAGGVYAIKAVTGDRVGYAKFVKL